MESIRYDEWLAELSRVNVVHPSAFTTRELMGIVPCGERKAENLIRRGIAENLLRPTRKAITDMAGRPQTVPAYEPVKPATRKPRREQNQQNNGGAPCFRTTSTTIPAPTSGSATPSTGRSLMTMDQENHLLRIKGNFSRDADAKYRAGVREHGGNLWEIGVRKLLEEGMKEAVDQYVYLATALELLDSGYMPGD